MFSRLRIHDFKCFSETECSFSKFNLLVGANSSGKSTLLQAILLMVQAYTDKGMDPLNGHFVSLGKFNEARNFITNAKSFDFLLEDEAARVCKFSFFESEENGQCRCDILTDHIELFAESLDFTKRNIHYLSAGRIGSLDVYRNNYDKYDDFGVRGQFAIDYFEKNKSIPVQNEKLLKDMSSKTLSAQVNWWLNYITGGQLYTEDVSDTDIVKVYYAMTSTGRRVRPINIGAGLGYLISVLIMGLAAQEQDVFIVENPEIHLHPRAQSRLMEFFVSLSEANIQVFLETHSDHIFNGVRKAIYNKTLSQDAVAIYYFNLKNNISQATQIKIADSGAVENQVPGLFDQFDEDLEEMLGI